MKAWYEEGVERDEIFEENQEEMLRDAAWEEIEVPDVWWAEDIQKIADPEVREKEIAAAEKILEKQEELNRRFEADEIDEFDFWAQHEFELGKESRKAATRSGLESVGITYDDRGDLSEDWDLILAEAEGDPRPGAMKRELKEMIDSVGPERSEDLADEMLERGEISEETHQSIVRQARMRRK